MARSEDQEQCLREFSAFKRDKSRRKFILKGKAGTGKTTLSFDIRQDLPGRVGVYAYTGKAASVLRRKGHHEAKTLHSDLYTPLGTSRKRLDGYRARLDVVAGQINSATNPDDLAKLKEEKEELLQHIQDELAAGSAPSYALNTESAMLDLDWLLVDEISMVGSRICADVEELQRRSGFKLILMGDPRQLPPVKDTAVWMKEKEDFELRTIHRQAQDNPILHLAYRAADGLPLKPGTYGESRVTYDMEAQWCLDCDQMLVGKNDTRQYYNKALRQRRGYTDLVEVGEKLMCLRNSKEGFFNGQIWYVEEIVDELSQQFELVLRSEDPMEPTRRALVWKDSLAGKEMDWMDAQGAQSMVSAQAVTVHKFQGSEGDHIVLMDEARAACYTHPKEWLYTGITRAKKKIDIILPSDKS